MEVETTQAYPPKESYPFVRVLELNDELKLRLYGTELIFEAGLMLQVPQVTISIAQRIYHRFYNTNEKEKKWNDFPPFHIAMTCTYLACKVNEEQRKHRDVLTVFDRIFSKRKGNGNTLPLDAYSTRYKIWRDVLMRLELRILATLGYINIRGIEFHKYLSHYLDELDLPVNVSKKAWSYLNDFHRIPNILDYNPTLVSCACILLAARKLKLKLPDEPCWCKLFAVNKTDLLPIASIILELLELPKKLYNTLPDGLKEDKESLDTIPNSIKQMTTIYDNVKANNKDSSKNTDLKNGDSKSNLSPIIANLNNKDITITKTVTNMDNSLVKLIKPVNKIKLTISNSTSSVKRGKSREKEKGRDRSRSRDRYRDRRRRERRRDKDREYEREKRRERERKRERDKLKSKKREKEKKDKKDKKEHDKSSSKLKKTEKISEKKKEEEKSPNAQKDSKSKSPEIKDRSKSKSKQ